MFHVFCTGTPSSVSSRAEPGQETCTTLKGPSHMGESLWSPSLERIHRRTRSPASSVRGAYDAAVIAMQRLLILCCSDGSLAACLLEEEQISFPQAFLPASSKARTRGDPCLSSAGRTASAP
jgi:hypothetical protein